MIPLKAGGKVYGAKLSAAERKAMNIEINRQIVESDRIHASDIDATILWVLADVYGWRRKRLRRFWESFRRSHDALLEKYEMQDDPGADEWLCKTKLKEIGVDVEAWNAERET